MIEMHPFLEQYRIRGFSNEQIGQIAMGYTNGLTEEQVDVFARIYFDRGQMLEIRMGLQNGLSVDEVSKYADPKWTWQQMSELRMATEADLAPEKMVVLSDPKLSWEQMEQIRLGFIHGLSMYEVSLYSGSDVQDMQKMRLELQKKMCGRAL